VLAPLTTENQHPDHIAVGRAVRDAARLARYGGLEELVDLPTHRVENLYFYSITQSFLSKPTVLVNVSALADRWMAAMQCHKSQMKTRNYDGLVMTRSRAAGAAMGVEYAVPLWTEDPLAVPLLSQLPPSGRNF